MPRALRYLTATMIRNFYNLNTKYHTFKNLYAVSDIAVVPIDHALRYIGGSAHILARQKLYPATDANRI